MCSQAGPYSGDDSELPVTLVGHKSSQAAPLAVDYRDGSLVFAPVSETALAAWLPGSAEHRYCSIIYCALGLVLLVEKCRTKPPRIRILGESQLTKNGKYIKIEMNIF